MGIRLYCQLCLIADSTQPRIPIYLLVLSLATRKRLRYLQHLHPAVQAFRPATLLHTGQAVFYDPVCFLRPSLALPK